MKGRVREACDHSRLHGSHQLTALCAEDGEPEDLVVDRKKGEVTKP